jgi:glycolate oxidase FAD binding subunit
MRNQAVRVEGASDRRLGTIEEVGRLIGAGSVDETETVWRHACAGVKPVCCVLPRSSEEVVQLLALAHERRLGVVPTGNGTHLNIGFPPRRFDLALSVRRLERLIAHDAADMTATVEAGITLMQLNQALSAAGQWLPLDPPRAEEMTIGGLIAADRTGPLRLGYGKVRDMLIGIKVALADGKIVRGGGRVVKNVAGYDLPKLLVGSYGTLGVILEATFKVRPLPPILRLFVVTVASIEESHRRGLNLLGSNVTPVLLEAFNSLAAEALGLGSSPTLVVGFAGSAAEVEEQQGRLDRALGRVQMVDEQEQPSVLKALRAFPQPAHEDVVVARVSALPSELGRLLARVEDEAELRGLSVELSAHVGSGVAWCQISGYADPLSYALLTEWMRLHVRERKGWVVFEALPPRLYGRVDPWGFNEASAGLMLRIKQALDPSGVLSPGRFVGGI